MPRISDPFDPSQHGRLDVRPNPSKTAVEVFYTPPPRRARPTDAPPVPSDSVKLLDINYSQRSITIHPIITWPGPDLLDPKYDQVRRITLADATPVLVTTSDATPDSYHRSITFGPTTPLDDSATDISDPPTSNTEILSILEELPRGFTKDYDYGLGLAKEYRFIVEAVEEISDCEEIVISKSVETHVDSDQGIFYMSAEDFEEMRKALDRTTRHAQTAARSVKNGKTYNLLAARIGRSPKPIKTGRHKVRRLLTAALESDLHVLSHDEQDELLLAISKNARSIAEARPEDLVRLRNDIELVNFETLLQRVEEMIDTNAQEQAWQELFVENPIILSMGFGYPIAMVRDKAVVGGQTMSGGGHKIADFVVKNSMTNNVAIVEIKRPDTIVLGSRYRGELVPSNHIVGGVSQILTQKYQLQREIAIIKERNRIYDIETYAVQCCLIVGRIPVDEEGKRAFELFRRNSRDVEIVTFDEVFERLRDIYRWLSESEEDEVEQSVVPSDEELPF